MAKIKRLFQQDITQPNVFQGRWGEYPFQKSVFQGINRQYKIFQTNIYQDNTFNETVYEIDGTFDVSPTILKFINETIQVNESVSRLTSIFVAIGEALQFSEDKSRLKAMFRYINETEQTTEVFNYLRG